jgi:hypothetical protein
MCVVRYPQVSGSLTVSHPSGRVRNTLVYPQGSGSLTVSHPSGRVRNVDHNHFSQLLRIGMPRVPYYICRVNFCSAMCYVVRALVLALLCVGGGWIDSRLVLW